MNYDAEGRTDWHFIPKDTRKGLILHQMTPSQRLAARNVFRAALSNIGYDKGAAIMQLEALLLHLQNQGGGNGPIRDTLRYYWTIFGEPGENNTWGLSVEGHHMSFNFVATGNQLVSVTPMALATNPATIMGDYPVGPPAGTRVVDAEERLGFELLAMLNDEQKSKAVVSDRAIREVRNAGAAQAAPNDGSGVSAAELNTAQRDKLRSIVVAFYSNAPAAFAEKRIAEFDAASNGDVRFGWWGSQERGVPHFFRVEAPTVQIEIANTQPDQAGNPANHIHALLRDPRGDFNLKVD